MTVTNPLIIGNMRFTVLDDRCVRMEFSPDETFRDAPTLFAANRNCHSNNFATFSDERFFHLTTPFLEIIYDYKMMRPKSGTLKVKTETGTWAYGQEDQRNLGGPLQSLDGCSEPMSLPEGLLSRSGRYVVDDTESAVLKDNWLAREEKPEGYFDLYFFSYGTDYKAALKTLTMISGAIPMLPRWSMGSWYSRWFCYTSDDYRQIVKEYAEHEIPLDVMVLDMEWHTRDAAHGHGWGGTLGWTGWTWNRELLPDAEKLLGEFKDDDLYVAMNVHPHDGIREHESCYRDFMNAMAESNPLKFDAGSRKYMENYFKYAHEPLEKEGCDIWWVDWQQDSIYPHVKGFPQVQHVPWLNYCYFNHMADGNRRGIAFGRWGGWGDHKHPIHFSGDTTANWEVLAFEIAFTGVSGNSGCFFWTHDMGGFCGRRNEELYARWLQFGALSAAMRLHSAGNDLDRRPWKWSSPYQESLRKSFELRAMLMPYLYTAMRNACRDSIPMIKPLYIECPEQEKAYANPQEFFIGGDLLAAPVTMPGDGPRQIAFQKLWIPEGEWYQFFTGERFSAGEHLVAADLMEMPLFVRAGVPIPLGNRKKKRLMEQDSAFDILLFPASERTERTFVLYEDDGKTDAYRRGEFSETVFSCVSGPDHASVTVAPASGNYAEAPEKRYFTLNLKCAASVKSVSANGEKIGYEFSDEENTLITKPVSCSRTESITFEIRFRRTDEFLIREKALEKRLDGVSPQTELMLNGSGVFLYENPLSPREYRKTLLIWPGKIDRIPCRMKQKDSQIESVLDFTGSGPFSIPYGGLDDEFVFSFGKTVFRF